MSSERVSRGRASRIAVYSILYIQLIQSSNYIVLVYQLISTFQAQCLLLVPPTHTLDAMVSHLACTDGGSRTIISAHMPGMSACLDHRELHHVEAAANHCFRARLVHSSRAPDCSEDASLASLAHISSVQHVVETKITLALVQGNVRASAQ